jgi:hypothetical protein
MNSLAGIFHEAGKQIYRKPDEHPQKKDQEEMCHDDQ